MTIIAFLRRLATEARAATAVEYGLIAALIVIAMIAGLANLARSTNGMLTNVSSAVERTRPN